MREGGIGTFDFCTSKWSIVGSEPSVEKKRGRAGWLNTLQIKAISVLKPNYVKHSITHDIRFTRESNSDILKNSRWVERVKDLYIKYKHEYLNRAWECVTQPVVSKYEQSIF